MRSQRENRSLSLIFSEGNNMLIKEFEFEISGLSFPVEAWIVLNHKIPHLPYQWFISHYYRPGEKYNSVYIPSRRHAASLEEAEILLMKYADKFTNLDVIPSS